MLERDASADCNANSLRNRTASPSLLSRPDWAKVFVSIPILTSETRSSKSRVSRSVNVTTGSLPSSTQRITTSTGLKTGYEKTYSQQGIHEGQVRMTFSRLTELNEHRTDNYRDRPWCCNAITPKSHNNHPEAPVFQAAHMPIPFSERIIPLSLGRWRIASQDQQICATSAKTE